MANEKLKKPHAIVFPFPYQGHVTPFINLAIKLASNGFTITFVNTEYIHHLLTKSQHSTSSNNNESNGFDNIFPEALKSGLDIRYFTINDGFPLSNFDEFWKSLWADFPTRVDEFIGDLLARDQSFDSFLLIADTFFHWSSTIGEKYNLVNVSLFTQPALVYSIGYHLDLLKEHGHYPCKDNMVEEINYLPGVKSISTRDVMSFFQEAEVLGICNKVSVTAFEHVKKADFILHYTVQELEFDTLQALSRNQPSYAIGPIYPCTNPSKTIVTKSLWSASDCTKWLDSKPPGSVLYISFGSIVQTNKRVIEEIANGNGLLLSEVNFIWVLREKIAASDSTNALPDGFKDAIKDRGMIVPWCEQIKVLSSPCVGGFVTHCGFNSTLESIWCGVPLICYPVAFDQTVVRKLVVENWKIGINLHDGSSVHREEVAKKIKFLMSATNSKDLREEVNKLKDVLQKAAEIDGSSEKNFDQFVKDLKGKISCSDFEHKSASC